MGTISLSAYAVSSADQSCKAGTAAQPGADAVGDYQATVPSFDDTGSDAMQVAVD